MASGSASASDSYDESFESESHNLIDPSNDTQDFIGRDK